MENLKVESTQLLANTPMNQTYTASENDFYNMLILEMQNALSLTEDSDDGSTGILGASDIFSSANPLIYSMLLNNTGTNHAGAQGTAAAQSALTRVGDPYSQPLRGQGDYVDCSSLTQWAYGQAGVSLPGTAAAQAKYCDENGFTISANELAEGDLVFWKDNNANAGRYKDIHHVGIYLGNGQIVDASSTAGEVVVRDLWSDSRWEIVQFARPY